MIGGIELGNRPLRVSVGEDLLINPPHAFDRADVESIIDSASIPPQTAPESDNDKSITGNSPYSASMG